MNRECFIARDLMPLYVENMASEESENFINEHIKNCHGCRCELENLKSGADLLHKEDLCKYAESAGAVSFKRLMKRIKSRFYILSYSLIILLIFLGFAWTAGSNMMYNSLIMPIVGVFGYYVFRISSIYKMPLLLLFIDVFVFVFGLVEIDFLSVLVWTAIYSIFVYAGILIAYLLHFVIRKE